MVSPIALASRNSWFVHISMEVTSGYDGRGLGESAKPYEQLQVLNHVYVVAHETVSFG